MTSSSRLDRNSGTVDVVRRKLPPCSWFAGGEMPSEKFTDYLLSDSHSTGHRKLRLFRSVFGYDAGEADTLRRAIKDQMASCIVSESNPTVDRRRFEVVIPDFVGPNGRPGRLVTAWASDHGDIRNVTPRLVTAYPDVP